jgi:hypothetical protein
MDCAVVTAQLVETLQGRVRALHRFPLQQQLERIDFIDEQIAQLEAENQKTECTPGRSQSRY